MSEIHVDLEALNKLNKAFDYATDLSQRSPLGNDTVLYLEDGQQLSCRYSHDDRPKDLFHFRRTRTETQIQLNNATRELFKQMVIDIFGRSIDDVPKSVRSAMELNKFDNTGRPLTARRVMAVNKAILSAMKGVNRLLGLSGAAAGNIAMVIAKGSGILAAEDPANELQARTNRHAKAQMASFIAKEIGVNLKKNSRYDAENGKLMVNTDTQFHKDLVRNVTISLKGKKMSVDPEKSRNELVQFLTGQKRATFNDSDNQTKLKACVLMGILQQGAFACFISSVGTAFDPQGKLSRLTPGSVRYEGSRQLQNFSVTKDKAGDLTIIAKLRYTAPAQLAMADDMGRWTTKKTDAKSGYVEYQGEIKLSAADLDKLSSADWEHFDYGEIEATENNTNIPNHFEAAANLIPDAFKYTGDVKVSCHIHAQETRNT